jgi:hypothetical protein
MMVVLKKWPQTMIANLAICDENKGLSVRSHGSSTLERILQSVSQQSFWENREEGT